MKSARFSFCLALLGACFLWIVCDVAGAATGTASLTFTRPTTYIDGSALPVTDITSYQAECTFTPTGGTAVACVMTGGTLPGSAQSGVITLTYPAKGGQACFVLKTFVGPTSSAGTQPPACKTFAPIPPSDPTNLTVTITLVMNITSASPIIVTMSDPKVEKTP